MVLHYTCTLHWHIGVATHVPVLEDAQWKSDKYMR